MPQSEKDRRHDEKRAAEKPWRLWYRTPEWRDARRAQLSRKRHCEWCAKQGKIVEATVAHHIRPHRGIWALFIDPRNLASVCRECHDGVIQAAEKSRSKPADFWGWPVSEH